MSLLLGEIMRLSERAADVLRRAELNTDKDLKSLTRQDLQDLFPGPEQFKLRRAIFDIIYKQKPVEKLLRDVKKFIPDQSLRDALTNNGVLVDYLQILKDIKSQLNNVQSFLDAHIDLLEEYGTKQLDQKSTCHDPPKLDDGQPAGPPQVARDASDSSGKSMPLSGGRPQGGLDASDSSGKSMPLSGGRPQGGLDASDSGGKSMPLSGGRPQGGLDASYSSGKSMSLSGGRPQGGLGASAPATPGPVDSHNHQRGVNRQGENGEPFVILSLQDFAETRLVYQMVVAGKTFDAHLQLMNKVKEQVQKPIQFTESDEDYQVTFVFCPISSRIASDVEAAMAAVKGDKPVILVLMHHTRDVKYTTSMRTWREDIEVILHVNVFYHETMHGLLKCDQNNAAVSQIRDKLLECFLGSGNAQAVGAESELTGSTSGRDGGNNRPSDSDRSSSGRIKWLPSGWGFGD